MSELDGQPIPRRRRAHRGGGVSRTKQADALKSDVNAIMARWTSTGTVPVRTGNPLYGDFSSGDDYFAALNKVRAAQSEFDALPAHIRKHCDNDAGRFLELVFDPARHEELVELGLAEAQDPTVPDDQVEGAAAEAAESEGESAPEGA